MLTPWKLLLCQLVVNISYRVAKASLCLGGKDIFATVRENSPVGEFIANLGIMGDPGVNSIRLCLTGENADWFYLEGRTIRLNTSFSKALDREVQGSVLMATLTCYENEIIQSEYRVMVEILNENDNWPGFLEETIQPLYISELTTVNSVVFTVTAKDADGDTIMYIIDKTSPDASYFRIDLPNSGKVILDKPLDFETKTQLEVVIDAVEMNTREKYNATATVTVNVVDGDDQYPQFLPCTSIYEDQNHTICTSPLYTTNVTESMQDTVLNFSPGPIYAEDGDRDLQTPLTYTILSGDDHSRFIIDRDTGEITLTRRVENRLLTPTFRLRVMAAQKNDLKKYTVATALVHVVAENHFPPHFNRTAFKGFLIESSSPATLVTTFGNQVLVVQVVDRDFSDGVNPRIHYAINPSNPHTRQFHITQEGILIAKINHLQAFERHIMEVIATDLESGEVAEVSIDIEVLPRGQPVPQSPFGEKQLFGDIDAGMAGGIAGGILLLAAAILYLLIRMARRRRQRGDPADRGSVALGKHPNVVNSGRPMPLIEEVTYNNEEFDCDGSDTSSLRGSGRVYSKTDSLPPSSTRSLGSEEAEKSMPLKDMLPIIVTAELLPKNTSPSVTSNIQTLDKSDSLKDETPKEERGGGTAGDSKAKAKERRRSVDRERRETRTDILDTSLSEQASVITKAEITGIKDEQDCKSDRSKPKTSTGHEERAGKKGEDDDEKSRSPVIFTAAAVSTEDEPSNKHRRNRPVEESASRPGSHTSPETKPRRPYRT